MKHLVTAAVFAIAAIPASAADLGITVTVDQPGFYGQISLGSAPAPEVIYDRPVIVERGDGSQEPVYLHVPPGYEAHWERHCREYNACGRPVYFVRDRWYNEVYVPHYRRHRDEYREHEEREREYERRREHDRRDEEDDDDEDEEDDD